MLSLQHLQHHRVIHQREASLSAAYCLALLDWKGSCPRSFSLHLLKMLKCLVDQRTWCGILNTPCRHHVRLRGRHPPPLAQVAGADL